MNIQILPNWCKKVGVLMFITFVILSGINGAIDGYNSYDNNVNDEREVLFPDENLNAKPKLELSKSKVLGDYVHVFNILAICGMIIYMMSKEKIEDDYINMLRLESYQLTTLIFLFACLIIYIISENIHLTVDYYIELFLTLYLVVFFIKKRIY